MSHQMNKNDLLLAWIVRKYPESGKTFTCRELSRGIQHVHPRFKDWDSNSPSGHITLLTSRGMLEYVPGTVPRSYVVTDAGLQFVTDLTDNPFISKQVTRLNDAERHISGTGWVSKKHLLLRFVAERYPNVGENFGMAVVKRSIAESSKVHVWDSRNTSSHLNHLVNDGLLDRVPGSRPRVYTVTDAGRQLATALVNQLGSSLEDADASIDPVDEEVSRETTQPDPDLVLDYRQIGEGVVTYITELKTELERALSEPRETLADLENEVNELTGQLRVQQTECRQLNNQLLEKDGEISRLTKAVETLNSRIANGIVEANRRDEQRQAHRNGKVRLGDIARIKPMKK